MPNLLVVAWACTSHPLRHKPCCGSVTLLTVNLTSLCFPTVNLSLPFGGCLISLCSETGLLPFNGLVNRKVTDHPTLLGLSCILIFALQLSAMYLGIKVAPAMRPDMPWTPSQDMRSCLGLHSNRLYAILPAPCHTLPHISVRVCCLLFVLRSSVAIRSPELLLLRRLLVFLAGRSWCARQFFKPLFLFMHMAMFRSGDISLSVLTLLFLLSHLVSRFLRNLWMYSFRLLENAPLRLVNAVGPGLRELSLDALVLFRPSRLCASCTSHRGPIVPKLACSNLRPASPVGAWSLRKVLREKCPAVGRLGLPGLSAGSAGVSG